MPPRDNTSDEIVLTSQDVWGSSITTTGSDNVDAWFTPPVPRPTLTAEMVEQNRRRRERDALEFTRQVQELQMRARDMQGGVEIRMGNITPKKKSVINQLDEIAKKNQDVFSEVTKIQNQIDTVNNDRVNEMMLKYDTLIFRFIHKGYSIQGKSPNTIKGYLNTLQQSLLYYVNEYFGDVSDRITFTNLMLAYFSPDTQDPQHNLVKEMASDIFGYKQELERLQIEKRKIMGIKESKPTVCEDYLNPNHSSRGDSRFVVGSAFDTLQRVGGGVGLIRPF